MTGKPSAEEVAAKFAAIKKAAKDRFGPSFDTIEPEYLFGFEEGKPLNLDGYAAVTFRHPKDPEYYVIREFDEAGMPKKPDPKTKEVYADPQFASIYEGIVTSNKIDDPILIYFYGGNLLVLDGATRLSVIGQRRRFDPDFIQKVHVQVFNGTEAEARGEMIRRNLEGRTRTLTHGEIIRSIKDLVNNDSDITRTRLLTILTGNPKGTYFMNHTVTIALHGSEKVIRAYEKVSKLKTKKGGTHLGKLAAIASKTDDHYVQNKILEETMGLSREEAMVRLNGAAAIPSKLHGIKAALVKSKTYCETCGISAQTAPMFETIQSNIDSLIQLIVNIDRDSMPERAREDSDDEHDIDHEDRAPAAYPFANRVSHEPDIEDLMNNLESEESEEDLEADARELPPKALTRMPRTPKAPKAPKAPKKAKEARSPKPPKASKNPKSTRKAKAPKIAKAPSPCLVTPDSSIDSDTAFEVLRSLESQFGDRRFVSGDVWNVLKAYVESKDYAKKIRAEDRDRIVMPGIESKVVMGRWVSANLIANCVDPKKPINGYYLEKHPNSKYTVQRVSAS